MEENTMTLEDVIRITANNLRKIQIPVELIDSIGIPIRRNIENLQMCLDAMEKKEKKKEQEEPADE